MKDCVLDASALVLALTGKTPAADTLRAALPGVRTHAPHLIDAEVGDVLRRHELTGQLDDLETRTALWAAHSLVDLRYPHTGSLAGRAWGLRHNLSFYDALYAGLAAFLGAPLLTCDAKLTGAPDLPCETELVG